MKANILIVDDDAGLRRALADRLRFWGHVPAEALDGREGLAMIAEREFDVVLLDLSMPGMTGMELTAGDDEMARSSTAATGVVDRHASVPRCPASEDPNCWSKRNSVWWRGLNGPTCRPGPRALPPVP